MSTRREVRIAGTGGQGVVTAGRILAEAAILSGHSATHNQAYGPQSRGGASRSDVVITEGHMGFPLADSIDVFVALTSEAHDRYRAEVADGARIIVDGRAVSGCTELDGARDVLPVLDTARSISGGPLLAGVVALGVVQGLEELVDEDALSEAVAAGVPPRHRDVNLAALRAGMALTRSGSS